MDEQPENYRRTSEKSWIKLWPSSMNFLE